MASQLSPEQLAILAKDDQGPKTNAIVITFTAFAFICVCLRLFARTTLTKSVGWEDHFIVLSMVFAIAMAVCQVEQVYWGNGKHQALLTLVQAINGLRYLYFSILSYCISLTLTKVSILLQYRRIFSLREARIPIYIVMGICVAYGIESVLTGTFTCIPVDAFWDLLKQPTARCVNENALYYANAGLNVATDLLVATLPVKAIWGLQIAMRQKVALLLILTLGWFVCIVSMLRLHSLVVLAQNPMDKTWYGAPTAYWSAIEANLAIVCASAPALKPLVVKILPAFSSQMGSYGSNSTRSGSKSAKLSFIRLKGTKSQSTMDSKDLESGAHHDVTALPAVAYNGPNRIHVTRDFEQHSENNGRYSESESQKDLVPDLAPSHYHKSRQ